MLRAAADRSREPGGRLRALDVAMGSGRHALPIARFGFTVFGVDRDAERVRTVRRLATGEGLSICVWVADLRQIPLPSAWFDLVVCTRYLDRAHLPALADTLRPGGLLAFETFTTRQLAYGEGPRSAEHLLRPGELARAFPMLTTLMTEEVESPEAVARLLARRDR